MAIYFPQFHEFKENNKFWGKGFTEWTLVNNFNGKIKKPHPDIGQYNMLDYSTRRKQAKIAKQHGINAFCYYHYWFKDKKVMYKGLEKMLKDGQPNLPFTLCWANEPWTKRWDGLSQETLLEQNYGTKKDWIKHYKYLSKYFKHKNYIKEDGCPILYIYRLEHIVKNNALEMLQLWKDLAKKDGFNNLKIISMLGSFENMFIDDLIDGYAEHQPNYNGQLGATKIINSDSKANYIDAKYFYNHITQNKKLSNNYTRGIFFGFDNSSRSFGRKAFKFINLSYEAFEELILKTILNIAESSNEGNNFILLNSWNEWSEQAMIEPNDQDGYQILNVIKKIFKN